MGEINELIQAGDILLEFTLFPPKLHVYWQHNELHVYWQHSELHVYWQHNELHVYWQHKVTCILTAQSYMYIDSTMTANYMGYMKS